MLPGYTLIILGIVLPALTGCSLLIFRKYLKAKAIYTIAISAHSLHTLFAFTLLFSTQLVFLPLGSWPVQFGISFNAEPIANLFLFFTSLTSLVCLIYSRFDLSDAIIEKSYYTPYLFFLTGTSGIILSGDLFNIYIWVEISVISIFASMAIFSHEDPKKQLQGLIKYIVPNLIATNFLLIGIIFIYRLTGQLNLYYIGEALFALENKMFLTLALSLLVFAILIKIAAFPFQTWMLALYHFLPPHFNALLASLSSKVFIYFLLKLLLVALPSDPIIKSAILVIGILTMFGGALLTLSLNNIRRVASAISINHIGIALVLIASTQKSQLAAPIFYVLMLIPSTALLILAAGVIEKINGTSDIRKMGALFHQKPLLASIFGLSLLISIGVPPLITFWAKIFVLFPLIQQGSYFISVLIILATIILLLGSIRLWRLCTLGEGSTLQPIEKDKLLYITSAFALLLFFMLILNLIPSYLLDHIHQQVDFFQNQLYLQSPNTQGA